MYEDRIKWIEHKGKRILSLDFSNLSAEDALALLQCDYYIKLEAAEPLGSILSLNIYHNLHFSLNFLNKATQIVKDRNKYYKATANIGVTGLVRVMIDSASKFMKQNLKNFDSKEAALDWLASQ